VSCAVCGAARPRGKLRKGDVEILECPSCGLAFWTPPAEFRPAAVYDAAYFSGARVDRGYDDYGHLESSLRLTFARRLARIPRPGAGARLLDVGAAYGFALDEARRAGWLASGLEIALPAARHASVIASGRVVVADAAAAPFASDGFDAVTLWDVLEHLPEPHAVVSEVARLLRPGALREAHGFRVVSLRAEASIYTLGYLVERLRKTLLGRSARRSARWAGSGLRIPVNLFDVVTVQAVLGSAA
jgi:SAM-dependent methyltransferase